MKTIFKNGQYEREIDSDAEFKVKHQGWSYVSKSEWKRNIRDIKTEQQQIEETKKEETISKKAIKRKKIKEKQRQSESIDKLLK